MEREDLVAPPPPAPTRLTLGEQKAIYFEVKRGGDWHAIANYFNTTVAEVEACGIRGDAKKW